MDIIVPAGMSYEFYVNLMKGENNVYNHRAELPKL
jgi:hypothetical protein